jgi:hypothetical protein
MEHVVFYPSAEGASAFERVSSLEEATRFVEQLRNSDNITEFSVYALTQVPVSFRAYYHVEVPVADQPATPEVADQPGPPEAVAETTPALTVAVDDSQAPVEPAPVADTAEPAAEAAPEPAAEAADPAPAVDDELVSEPADDELTMAPTEADDDRSAEWVAEASVVESAVVEAPAEAPSAEPIPVEPELEPVALAPMPATPFATAPPVTPAQGSDPFAKNVATSEPVAATESSPEPGVDVIPVPTGRRSMGFFAR